VKLIDLHEEYKAPSDIQKDVDQWIEGSDSTPALIEWLDHAPSEKHSQTVFRVLFDQKAVDKWAKYKDGEHITFQGISSCSHTSEAMQEGVLDPADDDLPRCILEIKLQAGKSYGRPVWHSDINHPENVQDEYLMKKGVSFHLYDVIDASDRPNRYGHDNPEGTKVYFLK
jgi:hypothetical protein